MGIPEEGKFLLVNIRNPGNLCLCNPEFSSRNRNPTNNWNTEYKSTDKQSGIQYLESGIQYVQSSIQNCLLLPYMG